MIPVRTMSVLVVALVVGLRQQPPKPVPLGKMAAEAAEPLSSIAEVRELSDGRVLALDGKDNVLQLFSADLRASSAVSRIGGGPTEYRRLTQLLPRSADSTLAYDVMAARFLIVDGTGKAVATRSLQAASGGMPVGPMAVRGYDQKGRLYYQGIKITAGPNGPALSDTAPILRLDPASKRVDTLARLRIGSPGMRVAQGPPGKAASVRLAWAPWPVIDEWALLPNGKIAIVRGADYRIEFMGETGEVTTTGPIAYERVKVAEIDKKKLREERADVQKEVSRAAASAQAAAPAAKGRQQRVDIAVDEPSEWPAFKPAFTQGALKMAPEGELWVMRLRSAAVERTLYDVFTPDGKLKMRVELPARTRVVGFGARTVYTARADEDELQYLQRWPRP